MKDRADRPNGETHKVSVVDEHDTESGGGRTRHRKWWRTDGVDWWMVWHPSCTRVYVFS